MAVVPTYSPVLAKAGERSPLSAASTAANVANFGVTVISTTKHFVIDNPVPGVRKSLVSIVGTTEAALVSSNSTATVFAGSTNNTLTFDLAQEAVTLVGYTTASWLIESNTGGVTLSATTGP